MCGIAGILKVHPPGAAPPPPEVAIPEVWLDILDESIKHRGPDGQGRFRDRVTRPDGSVVDVALVHRRLAIIDRAGGHQPMVSPRGRNEGEGLVAVVFNGCIYNHRELRKELQAAGHRFETDHSDTEVLVHGWREWGLGGDAEAGRFPIRRNGLAQRLEGMFAFAIWDRRGASLHLFRDLFGEKPLYHVDVPRGECRLAAFSSSAAGLTRLAEDCGTFNHHLDSETLATWIRFGFAEHPPLRHTSAVFPSTTTTLLPADQSAEPNESPQISFFEPASFCGAYFEGLWGEIGLPRSRVLEVSDVDRLLDEAVGERLETDVPLGCFLSGGIDSSLVAMFARRRLGRLSTFTVKMPDPACDESEHAAAVAKLLDTDHATLECRPEIAVDLVHLTQSIGLPFGDSSLLPTYWVSRAARNAVAVALGGDGGDELFGGYDRYKAASMLAYGKWPLRFLPGRMLSGRDPRSRQSRMRRLIDAAAHDGYRDLISIFPRSELRRLGLGGFAAGTSWLDGIEKACGPHSDAETAIEWDLSNYLPDDLMRKSDTASMQVALEVRSPFLDLQLAAAAKEATLRSLLPRGQRKGLLRQVARKYLPAEIVDRPKQGFAIPIGEWFRSDYGGMKQLLMDHLNSAEPWGPPSLGIDLNMKFVRQMLDEHMGTGMSGRVTRDHSQRLYMLLVLSIWAKWLGGLR